MTVKELKAILNIMDEDKEVIFKSGSGIEWEGTIHNNTDILKVNTKKPKMYIDVQ